MSPTFDLEIACAQRANRELVLYHQCLGVTKEYEDQILEYSLDLLQGDPISFAIDEAYSGAIRFHHVVSTAHNQLHEIQ